MIEGFYTFVDGHLKVKLFGSMENEINRQLIDRIKNRSSSNSYNWL